MLCPSCSQAVPDAHPECPHCGVIFAKWQKRTRERPVPTMPPPESYPSAEVTTAEPRLLRTIVVGVALAAALIGGWWWVEIRPRKQWLDDPNRGIAYAEPRSEPRAMKASIAGSRESAPQTKEVEDLLRRLRSENWEERMQAEMKLEALRVPVPYDREEDGTPDLGPADTDVLDWWAEIDRGTITASWRIHFGEDLFNPAEDAGEGITLPHFVRYEVSVEGGSLTEKIVKTYDAPSPGTEARDDEVLASGLEPGAYTINLFIHVQYIRPDGTPQILNQSVIPLRVAE